jgi:hypothetical protein
VTNTKATLAYGDFRLDLEGPVEFVASQLAEWRAQLPTRTVGLKVNADSDKPAANDSGGTPEQQAAPEKKTRKVVKTGGPSCGSRIRALIDESFFAAPKTAGQIGDRLREKATPYEGKNIAAALIHTVQAGHLRRVKADGVWTYVNP